MTHTYAAYKRPTLGQKTYTDWKWRAGNKFSKQMDRKKKAGVAIVLSDKIDFQRRAIKRDPEGHFIILKGRIHQENINIVNIYAPNRSTQIHKESLGGLQERYWQQHNYSRDFNTPLSKMDRSSKQNIKKDIVSLKNTLEEMDLTDIYREPVIPKKQNTYSFQMHMEYFQR